eukprot:scaffold873_cov393-Prasinococcus_capsulatus_cf.AAC.10
MGPSILARSSSGLPENIVSNASETSAMTLRQPLYQGIPHTCELLHSRGKFWARGSWTGRSMRSIVGVCSASPRQPLLRTARSSSPYYGLWVWTTLRDCSGDDDGLNERSCSGRCIIRHAAVVGLPAKTKWSCGQAGAVVRPTNRPMTTAPVCTGPAIPVPPKACVPSRARNATGCRPARCSCELPPARPTALHTSCPVPPEGRGPAQERRRGVLASPPRATVSGRCRRDRRASERASGSASARVVGGCCRPMVMVASVPAV